jgi:hypothetical protein
MPGTSSHKGCLGLMIFDRGANLRESGDCRATLSMT